MFSLIFFKSVERVLQLKVCGIRACNSAVVWGTPIEYMIGKHFVDALNEHRLPEEELFNATLDFLVELLKLDQLK